MGEVTRLLVLRQALLAAHEPVQEVPVLRDAPADETEPGDVRHRRADHAELVHGEATLAGDLLPVIRDEVLEVTDHRVAAPLRKGAVRRPGALRGGVRHHDDAVQVIHLVTEEVRQVILDETDLVVVVGPVELDVGLALRELDLVRGVRLGTPLDDTRKVALLRIGERTDRTDIERQGLAPGDVVNFLFLFVDVARKNDIHLAELRPGADRLDVVINEIPVDVLHHGIQADTLVYDGCLDVLAVHLLPVTDAPGVLPLSQMIRVVIHGFLLGNAVI